MFALSISVRHRDKKKFGNQFGEKTVLASHIQLALLVCLFACLRVCLCLLVFGLSSPYYLGQCPCDN